MDNVLASILAELSPLSGAPFAATTHEVSDVALDVVPNDALVALGDVLSPNTVVAALNLAENHSGVHRPSSRAFSVIVMSF